MTTDNKLLIFALERMAESAKQEHVTGFQREQALREQGEKRQRWTVEEARHHSYELGHQAAWTTLHMSFERQLRDLIVALTEGSGRG